MTLEHEIAQFNEILDIALGIGGAGEIDQHEGDPTLRALLQVAEVLAAADFQDELRPVENLKKRLGRRARATSPGRSLLPRRRAAFVLLAVLALVVATLLAVGPERALAALRGLLGYIPGVGLVDDSLGLRVLAEPVSQTREGVTVTIEQVVADGQRTVVVYTTDGLRVAAANSRGEGGPFGSPQSLRLPDGSTLEVVPESGYGGTPEPLIDAIRPEGGWPNYASRLVYPPIDADVDELTLVIPILETMPAGAAPENWELTFQLETAPENLTFAPLTVLTSPTRPTGAAAPATEETAALTNVATRNGFTLSLQSVVELEDGFVFTGTLSWEDSAFPTGEGVVSGPVIPTLMDAGGQAIPMEEVRLDALYGDHRIPWSYRTNRRIFSGPLALSILTIDTILFLPAANFEIDLGPDPQIGQSWEIDRDIDIAGHSIRLLSVRLRESPDTCSDSALEFTFASNESGASAYVEDVAPQPTPEGICSGGGGGGGGGPADPSLFYGLAAYRGVPNGLHRFSIRAAVPYVVAGPWEVVWQPPAIPGPTPTPEPTACLTFEGWGRLVERSDAIPTGVGGLIVVSVDAGVPTPGAESPTGFPEIRVGDLDGTDWQSVVHGGWPALSPDGTRLLYTDERGLHLLDLSTGEVSLLGTEGHAPIWSPDGSRILYVSFPGLRVMRVDGSGSEQIDVGGAEIAPPIGWLPDNQTIVYSVMSGEGFTFVLHDLQSGEARDLFSVQNKWGFGTVSPDGQWIAFPDRVFGGGSGVFVSRLDGSNRRLLVAPDIPMSYRLSWSPDGRWLLVNTMDNRLLDAVPGYRPVLIELSTCRAIAMPETHGSVEGWVR